MVVSNNNPPQPPNKNPYNTLIDLHCIALHCCLGYQSLWMFSVVNWVFLWVEAGQELRMNNFQMFLCSYIYLSTIAPLYFSIVLGGENVNAYLYFWILVLEQGVYHLYLNMCIGLGALYI